MAIKISTHASGIPPSGIRRIFNLARQYDDLISFAIGEPHVATPKHIRDAACQAIDDGLSHYTPNAGLPVLREAIAHKLARENAIQVDPESQVIATPGGMGALFLALQATISDGDEVVLTDPSYMNHDAQVALAGGRIVPVPLCEANAFSVDPADLERVITPRTRALVLNYPANPTGATLDADQLAELCRIIREHDLFVISDEVYEKFTYDDRTHVSIASLEDMADRVISVFSVSKTYAMTGWRLGYAVGPAHVIAEMTKLQEHVSAHPSSISQMAAVAALDGPQDCVDQLVSLYQTQRDVIAGQLRRLPGITATLPPGAFYYLLNVRDLHMNSEEAATMILEKAHVALVPGSAFGSCGEGYLRMSYAVPRDQLDEGLRRLESALG